MDQVQLELAILRYKDSFYYLATYLKNYADMMEGYLEKERLDWSDPYTAGERVSGLDVDHDWAMSFYPITLRESLFVASFSHFESMLNTMCIKLGEVGGFAVTLADLNGRGVTRAHLYLTKVAHLKIDTPSWEKVTFLNQLRNVIVHNSSQVEASNGKHNNLRKSATGWSNLHIPISGQVEFKSGFNKDALEVFIEFFDGLRRLNTRYAP